jgi:hypothetical protein
MKPLGVKVGKEVRLEGLADEAVFLRKHTEGFLEVAQGKAAL